MNGDDQAYQRALDDVTRYLHQEGIREINVTEWQKMISDRLLIVLGHEPVASKRASRKEEAVSC